MELSETTKAYTYEVAFSFLKEDLDVAQDLSDRLSDRLPTFIYTDRQDEVVGTEAMESFPKVYGTDARIVVILYRPKWGKTDYTRLEENAIRSRLLHQSTDFILLLKLEDGRPEWYSESAIYCNYHNTKVDVIVGHIEAMVKKRGGQVRPESAEDMAARLRREHDRTQAFEQLYNSERGVVLANETFNALYARFDERINALQGLVPYSHSAQKRPELHIMHFFNPVALDFSWKYHFSNSLNDARLVVELSNGQRFDRYSRPGEHVAYKKECYVFAQNAAGDNGWQVQDHSEPFICSEDLIEQWVKLQLGKAHTFAMKEQRQAIR
jgi:hypothetical protein